jgi:hypothetical protein
MLPIHRTPVNHPNYIFRNGWPLFVLILLLLGTAGCWQKKPSNKELILGDWTSLADTTYNVQFTKTKYRVNGTELFYYWPAPDSFVCYGEPFIHPGTGRKGRIIYFNKIRKLDADSLVYWSGFGQGRTEYAYTRRGVTVNTIFSRLKRRLTMP